MAGPQGAQGPAGPAGPPNPNAINAQNADNLDNLDSLDFIRSNAVFGGDLSGPFSDLQIGADKVGTAEVAPNSLTGADVLDSSIGGADITSSSVPGTDLSADSVTGAQIVESTLAEVPSAANASAVDGQSALTFNFNVSGSSVEPPPITTLFTLGGMTMRASCETVLAAPSIDELTLYASTDANNSYIRSDLGIPNDADWDIGEQPDGGSQWFDSRGDAAGLVVYRRSNTSGPSAQVISIILAWNTHLNGCMLSGTVLGH